MLLTRVLLGYVDTPTLAYPQFPHRRKILALKQQIFVTATELVKLRCVTNTAVTSSWSSSDGSVANRRSDHVTR